jgi:HAD superfamily hydrolase (TIGR01509 family)
MKEVERQVADSVEIIAGVEPMLAALPIQKSIVSNSHIATVEEAMLKIGLTRYFTGYVFSSESVANPKPAPDVYLLALKTLGLAPEQMIVVEDSITGATAAISAGLNVIGFTGASHIRPGHNEKLADLGVISVAANMFELREVLLGHLSRRI